jgi:hypothetical protein
MDGSEGPVNDAGGAELDGPALETRARGEATEGEATGLEAVGPGAGDVVFVAVEGSIFSHSSGSAKGHFSSQRQLLTVLRTCVCR